MKRRGFLAKLASIPLLGTVPAFAFSEVRRLLSKNVLTIRVKVTGMDEIVVVRSGLPDPNCLKIEHFSITLGPEGMNPWGPDYPGHSQMHDFRDGADNYVSLMLNQPAIPTPTA